jgi:uncharacterized protein Veg
MKELTIGESMFRIYTNGDIERKLKSGRWKMIPNVANQNQGYNVIFIQKKQYMRSRLVHLAYHDATTEKILMYHKDGNRLNCSLDNLSVETHQSINIYKEYRH